MERLEKITRAITTLIGGSGSKLEKALGESFPEGERYFGLENFGNTCYCNSVLQVLYFCPPFRSAVLEYYSKHQPLPANEADESLLSCLAELFNQIASQKRKTGVVAPKRFVQRVKKQKELFRGYMHQDAHEFLNFLLNELVEILEKEAKADKDKQQQQQQQQGDKPELLLANGQVADHHQHQHQHHNHHHHHGPSGTAEQSTPLKTSLSQSDLQSGDSNGHSNHALEQQQQNGPLRSPRSHNAADGLQVEHRNGENKSEHGHGPWPGNSLENHVVGGIANGEVGASGSGGPRAAGEEERGGAGEGASPVQLGSEEAQVERSAAEAGTSGSHRKAASDGNGSCCSSGSGGGAASGGAPTAATTVSDGVEEDNEDRGKGEDEPQEAERQAPIKTWIHDIFQGTLTNETRCLCCETVTARDESFLDLSLDIEQNSSVTSCLRNFSSTETLSGNDKFFCDTCCSLQEAQKRMRVKVPPRVLALHLKRFKYMEQLGRYKKLSYRVVFPQQLRLCNTVDDSPGAEAEYSLFAVIVHVGSGPNHGHYVSVVKSHGHWLFFDDENVEPIDESLVQTFFGSSHEFNHNNTDHGYFLFYECTQPDLLHKQPQQKWPQKQQQPAWGVQPDQQQQQQQWFLQQQIQQQQQQQQQSLLEQQQLQQHELLQQQLQPVHEHDHSSHDHHDHNEHSF